MSHATTPDDCAPFPGIRRYAGGDAGAAAFTAVAMFTASHRDLAERLRASLDAHGLRYALFEIPRIHRSISRDGVPDPALTKANFIRHALHAFGTPLLYLDADVVVRGDLRRIAALVDAGREFAIYNWLADDCTDCFTPVGNVDGAPAQSLYAFSHAVDLYAPEQLIASGPVQFWAPGTASAGLLDAWAACIAEWPRAADDECLDYAFNNTEFRARLRYAWLDKAHARYAWWPYVRPEIDHPQFPALGDSHETIVASDGRRQFRRDRTEARRALGAIPRDCLVDVRNGSLYRRRPLEGAPGQVELVPVGRYPGPLFPAPPAR